MDHSLSDAAKSLIDNTLGAGGKRGTPSHVPAHVILEAAWVMAVSGQPWRQLNEEAGNRLTAARRVRRWVEDGALKILSARVAGTDDLDQSERERIVEMIDVVSALPGRPRSVKGRGWTQRNPRKIRKKANSEET